MYTNSLQLNLYLLVPSRPPQHHILIDQLMEWLVDMQGTAKRWEVVTDYVRTRTQEEVLDMVKHGLKSRRGQQAKAEQFSIAKKRQGNTAIKSDPTGRMESFTDVDVNISGGIHVLMCESGIHVLMCESACVCVCVHVRCRLYKLLSFPASALCGFWTMQVCYWVPLLG